MAEDPKTRSLLLCVMDGHGEDGDKVAQFIKARFATNLFKHRDFERDIKSAISDVIARIEAEVLRGIYMFSFMCFLMNVRYFHRN